MKRPRDPVAANILRDKPQWYNALTSNCTTNIRGHTKAIVNPDARLDWRIFLNGYIDELMYERGTLDRSIPFADLKQRSLINDLAQANDDATFSKRIRSRLPGKQ